MEFHIRTAQLSDAEKILELYAYYIRNTAITFEYTVPSLEEFQARMLHTLQTSPYLVAEQGEVLLGFACAGPFHARAAYGWSAETTVYVSHTAHRQGIGKALYEALECHLKKMGILNLYACIGYPDPEDEYLTRNSAQFHAHLGFQEVGRFHRCGYKFNRWYHMIWMEKIIGEHKTPPPAVTLFSDPEEK